MLISDEYKEQNRKLHENPGFGVSSAKWANEVRGVTATYGAQSVLDYGCGKGLLKQSLGWANMAEYDPAIDGKSQEPLPADVVVCTDVLEHIEPECLDSVLDDLKRLTKKAGFFTVATRPAKKTLPDGRNAHLIQESHAWWLPKLLDRFVLRAFHNLGGEFVVVVEAKDEA